MLGEKKDKMKKSLEEYTFLEFKEKYFPNVKYKTKIKISKNGSLNNSFEEIKINEKNEIRKRPIFQKEIIEYALPQIRQDGYQGQRDFTGHMDHVWQAD